MCAKRLDLEGKTCVITGATSGIGEVAAERLAAMGARLLLIARDRARGEATLQRLRTRAPGAAHRVHHADLMLIAEVKRVAAEIAAQERRIDILVNNAGAIFSFHRLTAEGLERTFALNHMAYFVLSHGLREALVAAAPARVVNTASAAHQRAQLHFEDLQFARAYNGLSAIEAVQHPVHARALTPMGPRGRHRQLPASGLRRQQLRQRKRRTAPVRLAGCAGVCDLVRGGGGNHRASRLLPRGRRSQRRLFLQVPADRACPAGRGRQRGKTALAGERKACRHRVNAPLACGATPCRSLAGLTADLDRSSPRQRAAMA
jgi:NAD(P)-dependent dehydrogenase (short-subunit alcohol dehydrogenase family)